MGISVMGSETTVREDGQSCREGELASTVPACHANCTRRALDPRAAHAQTGVLCSLGHKDALGRLAVPLGYQDQEEGGDADGRRAPQQNVPWRPQGPHTAS